MKVLDYDDVSKCSAFETGDKIVLNGQIFKCVGGSEMDVYSEACEGEKHYVITMELKRPPVITMELKRPRVNVKSTKYLRRVKKLEERLEAEE